jgi:hypothetical protein
VQAGTGWGWGAVCVDTSTHRSLPALEASAPPPFTLPPVPVCPQILWPAHPGRPGEARDGDHVQPVRNEQPPDGWHPLAPHPPHNPTALQWQGACDTNRPTYVHGPSLQCTTLTSLASCQGRVSRTFVTAYCLLRCRRCTCCYRLTQTPQYSPRMPPCARQRHQHTSRWVLFSFHDHNESIIPKQPLNRSFPSSHCV